MSRKPGDPYSCEFCTQRFDTGAATNADSLPVATANRNGTDDAAFVLTVANLDTGRYKVTGTIPAGYVRGDSVNVTAAATVNGVAGKGVIDSFVMDSKRVGDLVDAPAAPSTAAIAAAILATPANLLATSAAGAVTVGSNLDKTGYTAATVLDKSGYSLAQAFPGNFSTLSIDSSGRIDVGRWRGTAPATLSVNGFLQALVTRWLTDDGPGTPNPLVANRVDASGGALAANVITASAIAAAALAGKGDWLTAAQTATAVWDELLSAHTVQGSAGAALAGAASSGGGPEYQGIWQYASQTAMANPGGGRFRGNAVTGPSVTQVAISNLSQAGTDYGNILRSLQAGDTLYIQDKDDATRWLNLSLTSGGDMGGWFEFGVAYIGSAGAAFAANSNCALLFRRASVPPPDPWAVPLPGSYAAGTAGSVLGRQLGGAFTTPTSSVYTAAALANTPMSAGGNVTVGAYAPGMDPGTMVLGAQVPDGWAAGSAGAALGKIGSGAIYTVAPVGQDGSACITQGASYSASQGRALVWQDADNLWPDLTGASITVNVEVGGTTTYTRSGGVLVATGGGKSVQWAPTAADTAALPLGEFVFDVSACYAATGDVVPLVHGIKMTVSPF
jgi:hypothetical protein